MESARINPKNPQGDYLLRPTYDLLDQIRYFYSHPRSLYTCTVGYDGPMHPTTPETKEKRKADRCPVPPVINTQEHPGQRQQEQMSVFVHEFFFQIADVQCTIYVTIVHNCLLPVFD